MLPRDTFARKRRSQRERTACRRECGCKSAIPQREIEATGDTYSMVQSDATQKIQTSVPICVDLDGTLVCTDTLWECLLAAWRRDFRLVFAFPFWLWRGKAYLKQQAAKHGQLDPRTLPYDSELLKWLLEQRACGRELILATGSTPAVANSVAQHLGFFSEVMCSTETTNLTGNRKLVALEAYFGCKEFEYIGNCRADLPIWSHLGHAHVRGVPASLCRSIRTRGIRILSQGRSRSGMPAIIARQCRIYQWSKNLLVFLPLLASHSLSNLILVGKSLLAFVAFNCIASAFYIFNDLLDLQRDRLHPNKRRRPLACGELSIPQALAVLVVALIAGMAASAAVSLKFLGPVLVYVAGTAVYSSYLKRVLLVDVFALASLYTIRVIAGGVATGIPISSWTLGYTSFLFLSLALMKRYSELAAYEPKTHEERIPGRAYQRDDLPIIGAIGIASGSVAALLMALYLRSPEVEMLYRRPMLLLPLCIAHMYWICRAWIFTHRQAMHDDPIVFALKDHVTRKLLIMAGISALLAV